MLRFKATTLLFLVATFCLAGIALAEHDDGHPVTAPVYPPSTAVRPPHHPPVDPSADSPVDPPAHPPVPRRLYLRGIVAVKDSVFCQSCKHAGSDDLMGASPINGAVVKVQCKNNDTVIELSTTTSASGYFFLQRGNDFDNCKAYQVSSPLATCNILTDLHGGITGAELKWCKPSYLRKPSYTVYLVEPFVFLPKCN